MESLSVRFHHERRAGSFEWLIPSYPANRYLLIANRFRLEKSLSGVRGRAVSDYEDDEWIADSMRISRPLDELEEVVDEHRLDLRFVNRTLSFRANARQQRREDEEPFSNGASS